MKVATICFSWLDRVFGARAGAVPHQVPCAPNKGKGNGNGKDTWTSKGNGKARGSSNCKGESKGEG